MAGKPKVVATNPVFPETLALLEESATLDVNPRLCEDWALEDRPRRIDPRLINSSVTVSTPHIGSGVAEIRRQIELAAARSILDVLAGRLPSGAVNNPGKRSNHAQSGAR